MANVANSNVDYVEGDDEEFEQLYQEFEIQQLEEDSLKPKNQPKSKEPVGVFPTILGFRLRDEILLLGDYLLVHRRNQIVYGVIADWDKCVKILKFLQFVIPLDNQYDPIHYVKFAVRFIKRQLPSRSQHWFVLVGGFNSDTPTEPRLWRGDKEKVIAIEDRTSIGNHKHHVDFVMNTGAFQRDMSVEEVIVLGESFRVFLKKKTDELKVISRLTRVLISPSSALSNNSQQQQPSPIFNDQGALTTKRAKRCAKIGKQIVTAVKNGGLDTVLNTALADILERAEMLRVPKEILDRSTKKAREKGQEPFIEKLYKVNVHGGLEMVVEVLTDDVNRSEAAVREVLEVVSIKMADSVSIMSNFKRTWVVSVKVTDALLDQISRLASDSGAARPTVYKDGSERYYKIICETEKIYTRFCHKLLEKGIAFESDYELLPLRKNSEVDENEMIFHDVLMARLLDLDDVDAVYTNLG